MKRTPYAEIRDSLATGDLLLCAGGSEFSKTIKRWQGHWSSHVALIVKRHGLVPSGPKVWESCNKVELVELDNYFVEKSQYSASDTTGDVVIRQMIVPAWFDRLAMAQKLERFIEQVSGRPYETHDRELALAVLGEWGNRTEALEEFFCSELVAESLQRMNVLPIDANVFGYRPSNSFRPRDFAYGGELFLLSKIRYGPEILLKEKCA